MVFSGSYLCNNAGARCFIRPPDLGEIFLNICVVLWTPAILLYIAYGIYKVVMYLI